MYLHTQFNVSQFELLSGISINFKYVKKCSPQWIRQRAPSHLHVGSASSAVASQAIGSAWRLTLHSFRVDALMEFFIDTLKLFCVFHKVVVFLFLFPNIIYYKNILNICRVGWWVGELESCKLWLLLIRKLFFTLNVKVNRRQISPP